MLPAWSVGELQFLGIFESKAARLVQEQQRRERSGHDHIISKLRFF